METLYTVVRTSKLRLEVAGDPMWEVIFLGQQAHLGALTTSRLKAWELADWAGEARRWL